MLSEFFKCLFFKLKQKQPRSGLKSSLYWYQPQAQIRPEISSYPMAIFFKKADFCMGSEKKMLSEFFKCLFFKLKQKQHRSGLESSLYRYQPQAQIWPEISLYPMAIFFKKADFCMGSEKKCYRNFLNASFSN